MNWWLWKCPHCGGYFEKEAIAEHKQKCKGDDNGKAKDND